MSYFELRASELLSVPYNGVPSKTGLMSEVYRRIGLYACGATALQIQNDPSNDPCSDWQGVANKEGHRSIRLDSARSLHGLIDQRLIESSLNSTRRSRPLGDGVSSTRKCCASIAGILIEFMPFPIGLAGTMRCRGALFHVPAVNTSSRILVGA
jgi:hypothetical protein